MDTWLDAHAKRAAARSTTAAPGISRRRFLGRTAVVAGVAWTAPTVLSAAPAWAGLSTCTTVVCGGQCCEFRGDLAPGCNGTQCPGALGGFCKTKNGEGVAGCNTNSTHCNGVEGKNVCGGPGATCKDNTDCVSNVCTDKTCTSARRSSGAESSTQSNAPVGSDPVGTGSGGTSQTSGSSTPSGGAGTPGSTGFTGTTGTSGTTGPSTSVAPTG